MYNDVNCPYCDTELDINHDDGYGYEEGKLYQHECSNCEKTFAYTTIISFDYEAQKADCLNGGRYKWKRSFTYPIEFTKMICTQCGFERKPLAKEMLKIND